MFTDLIVSVIVTAIKPRGVLVFLAFIFISCWGGPETYWRKDLAERHVVASGKSLHVLSRQGTMLNEDRHHFKLSLWNYPSLKIFTNSIEDNRSASWQLHGQIRSAWFLACRARGCMDVEKRGVVCAQFSLLDPRIEIRLSFLEGFLYPWFEGRGSEASNFTAYLSIL